MIFFLAIITVAELPAQVYVNDDDLGSSYTLNVGTDTTFSKLYAGNGDFGELIINGGDSILTVSSFEVGMGTHPAGAARSRVELHSGTLLLGGWNRIGLDAPGEFIQTGGTVKIDSSGWLIVGDNGGGNAAGSRYEISGAGSLLQVIDLSVGQHVQAEFVQNGGTVTATTLHLGHENAGDGTYYLNAGTLNADTITTGTWRAAMIMAGGTLNVGGGGGNLSLTGIAFSVKANTDSTNSRINAGTFNVGNAFTLDVETGGVLELNTGVSATGGLTKTGGGELIFMTNTNNVSGELDIQEGSVTLVARNNNNICLGNVDTITVGQGAVLNLVGDEVLGFISARIPDLVINGGTVQGKAGESLSQGFDNITMSNGGKIDQTNYERGRFHGPITVTAGEAEILGGRMELRYGAEPVRFTIEDNAKLTITSNIQSSDYQNYYEIDKYGLGTLVLAGNANLNSENVFEGNITRTGGESNAPIRIAPGANQTGSYFLEGGKLTGQIFIAGGSNSNGTFTVTGGTVDSSNIIISDGSGSTGTMTVGTPGASDGPSVTTHSNFEIGKNGVGTLNIYSGTFTVDADWTHLGRVPDCTVNHTGGTFTVKDLYIAESGAPGATYNLGGTGILNAGRINVGQWAAGFFNQSGGTMTVGTLFVGNNGKGIYDMTGGYATVNSDFLIRANDSALRVSGGTMEVKTTFWIGRGSGGTGYLEIAGGEVWANTGYVVVGDGGKGIIDQTGGLFRVRDNINISEYGGSDGSGYYLKDGTLTVGNSFYLGYRYDGFVNQTGGLAEIQNLLLIGYNDGGYVSTGIGTYDISAGTLAAGNVTVRRNDSELNVSGSGVVNAGRIVADGGDGLAKFTMAGGTVNINGGSGDFTLPGFDFSVLANTGSANSRFNAGRFEVGGTFEFKVAAGGHLELNAAIDNGINLTKTGGGILNFLGDQSFNNLNILGGTLYSKNITGFLHNTAGVYDLTRGVTPASPADLNEVFIDGFYTQEPGGTLRLNVLKDASGDFFADLLNVSGDMSLAGILDVLFTGELSLEDIGTRVNIFQTGPDYGEIFGDFNMLRWNAAMGEYVWTFGVNGDGIGYLELGVPEPATWGMLLFGILGGGLLFARRKTKSANFKRFFLLALCCSFVVTAGGNLWAQTNLGVGDNPVNSNMDLDRGIISVEDGTLDINAAVTGVSKIHIGDQSSDLNASMLNVNGSGSLRSNDHILIGVVGDGTLTIDGGEMTVIRDGNSGPYGGNNIGLNFDIGRGTTNIDDVIGFSNDASGTGTLNIINGGKLTFGGNWFRVGLCSLGTVTQDGGTVTINSDFYIADNSGSAGSSYHLQAGTLTVDAPDNITIGQVEAGSFHQSGGTATFRNKALQLGNVGVGTYHLSGGTLTAERGIAVRSGGSSLNVSETGMVPTVLNTTEVIFGNGSGRLNISGGTVNIGTVSNSGGIGEVSISGGLANIGYLGVETNMTSGTISPGGANAFGVMEIDNLLTVEVDKTLQPANIALGKPASQSSNYNPTANGGLGEYPAGNAVDGNTNTSNFSHTNSSSGTNQWWQVDLGDEYLLGLVRIYNRYGSGGRLTNSGSGYYFNLYDDEILTNPDALPVWTSPRYTVWGDPYVDLDFGYNAARPRGSVLRLVRDFSGTSGISGDDLTLNLTEVQVYNYLDLSLPVFQFDLGADNESDLIHILLSGSLNIQEAVLEISFVDGVVEGEWELFRFEGYDGVVPEGVFEHLALNLPTIAGYEWNTKAFYTKGRISLSEVETPEPATWGMLFLGVLGGGIMFSRRRTKKVCCALVFSLGVLTAAMLSADNINITDGNPHDISEYTRSDNDSIQITHGTLNFNGETVTMSGTSTPLDIGTGSGSIGILNIHAGSDLDFTCPFFRLGVSGGKGFVNHDGGDLVLNLNYYIADQGGSAGSEYNLSGGSLTVNAGEIRIGQAEFGSFNQTGGTATFNNSEVWVGNAGGGAYNLSDGTMTASHGIRLSGGSSLNISGGTMTVGGIANAVSGGAAVTLSGGTINLGGTFDLNGIDFSVKANSGSANSRISGGTFSAGSAFTFDVETGGVLELNTAVTASDGLTKTGGGELIFQTNTSNISGGFDIQGGTVTLLGQPNNRYSSLGDVGTITVRGGAILNLVGKETLGFIDTRIADLMIDGGTVQGIAGQATQQGFLNITMKNGGVLNMTNLAGDSCFHGPITVPVGENAKIEGGCMELREYGGNSAKFIIENGATLSISSQIKRADWYNYDYIDKYGPGSLVLSGNTVSITSERVFEGDITRTGGSSGANIHIGVQNDKTAAYYLQDGTLNNNEIFVGNASGSQGALTIGDGSTNPSVTTTNLRVGQNGTGVVNIYSGTLTTNGDHVLVGTPQKGIINQYGGTVNLNSNLYIADNASAGGSAYNLEDGDLYVKDGLFIGQWATGFFVQSGGTVTANNVQICANGSELSISDGDFTANGFTLGASNGFTDVAYLTISGGTLTTNNSNAFIGKDSQGIADQTGGTFHFKTIYMADAAGIAGTTGYYLKNGIFHGDNNLIVGEHSTAFFEQSGGTASLGGSLNLGTDSDASSLIGIGTYTLTGGTLTVGNSVNIRSNGSGMSVADGTVTANNMHIGLNGDGIATLSIADGGSVTVNNEFNLGHQSKAVLDISGGSLTVGSGRNHQVIGLNAPCVVNQTGGTVTFNTNHLYFSDNAGGSGTEYRLIDGTFTSNRIILGQRGDASFIQTGGTADVNGELLIGSEDGGYVNSVVGTYALAGGRLKADNITIRANSKLEMTDGGTLWTKDVNGSLTNTSGILDLTHGALFAETGRRNGVTFASGGQYTQEADGILRLELYRDGNDIYTNSLVADLLTLSGTLDLILTGDAWVPADIDLFSDGIKLFEKVLLGGEVSVSISSDSTADWFSGMYWTFGTDAAGIGYLNPGLRQEAETPEPATWGMLLAGAVGLLFLRRKTKKV